MRLNNRVKIALMLFGAFSISGTLLAKDTNCILYVSPLKEINSTKYESRVFTRRLEHGLKSEAAHRFTRCSIKSYNGFSGVNSLSLILSGDYIQKNRNGALMIVIRMKDKSGRVYYTCTESWERKNGSDHDIRMLSRKIVNAMKRYYSAQLGVSKKNTNLHDKGNLGPKDVKYSITLAVCGGYIEPIGKFRNIGEYGYGGEMILGFPGLFGKGTVFEHMQPQFQIGYSQYATSGEDVDFLQSFSVKGGLGYRLTSGMFYILPAAGIGQQISTMSFDSRDEPTPPYLYESEIFYQPMVFCSVQAGIQIKKIYLFLLPSINLFYDGGEKGIYAAFHLGCGTDLSWRKN